MKLAEREPLDLDCVAGMTRSQWFFRISKCVSWRRHPFGDLNTGMVRTWCELAAGQMANAMPNLTPRSRKKRTQAFSVPTAEKFERKLCWARLQEDRRRLSRIHRKVKKRNGRANCVCRRRCGKRWRVRPRFR